MERVRKKEGCNWCAVKGITCWGFFFLQTTKADILKNVSFHTIKLKSMGSKTTLDLTQLFYAQKNTQASFTEERKSNRSEMA